MAALLLALFVAATAMSATDRQSRAVALPAGRSLTLEIAVGAVRIEGWDRDDAQLVIERRAPSTAALDRLPVVVDESPERVSVRILQEGGGTDAALVSDVTVRVPRLADIHRVQVLEGRVTLMGLGGRVAADVRRGPIEATGVSGVLRLETGIGDVSVSGARLSAGGLLRLRAFNGDVSLALAERPAHARVLALALNGTIRSDIPLTMRDQWGPRWGEAAIGRGEPVISLDVVTGTIDITSRTP